MQVDVVRNTRTAAGVLFMLLSFASSGNVAAEGTVKNLTARAGGGGTVYKATPAAPEPAPAATAQKRSEPSVS